jgi:abortive infection alpha-like protein
MTGMDDRDPEGASGEMAEDAPVWAEPAEEISEDGGLADSAPAFARLYAGAWLRTARFAAETSMRASRRLARAAIAGESATDVLADAARTWGREVLGIEDLDERIAGFVPDYVVAARQGPRPPSLRERGEELLRRSADVDYEQESHPAYEHMLRDIAPDEARILRLLATQGAQPAVDVRGGLPLASDLVALGLSMIGEEAGCRYVERTHAYLNNLNRLGIIWFAHERLPDPLRYQVLEAQPDVLEAMRSAGRFGRTVRRAVHLTPFGEDFCATVLPLETHEMEALAETPPGEAPLAAGEAPVAEDPAEA